MARNFSLRHFNISQTFNFRVKYLDFSLLCVLDQANLYGEWPKIYLHQKLVNTVNDVFYLSSSYE